MSLRNAKCATGPLFLFFKTGWPWGGAHASCWSAKYGFKCGSGENAGSERRWEGTMDLCSLGFGWTVSLNFMENGPYTTRRKEQKTATTANGVTAGSISRTVPFYLPSIISHPTCSLPRAAPIPLPLGPTSPFYARSSTRLPFRQTRKDVYKEVRVVIVIGIML
jgi:hypothetical protein